MPKECFVPRNFNLSSLELISQANQIISEYIGQGFILTLRQLYYQMVSRDLIPNKVQSYKRLGSIINDARYAGLIDWSALEDRTRNLRRNSHWNDPSDIINSAAASFALDKWSDQEYRPEIWIEKEALAGVIERAAGDNDVNFLSCRGYMSASEMYEAGRRIKRIREQGQEPVIIYLGDHDPSGLDMSEGDIPKRFEIFMKKWGDDPVTVNRIALNWDQIEQYNPPPNPAKETDSRFNAYEEEFGSESWELDALEPNILLGLIQDAIDDLKDPLLYEGREEEQEKGREVLKECSERWNDVVNFLTAEKEMEEGNEED